MRVPLSILVTALAATLHAQQDIVHLGDGNPMSGVPNAFPFGASGVRTQQLVPGSVLGSAPALVQDLFVAPAQEGPTVWSTSEVVYADIEIRVGTTQLQTLTTDWATNLPSPVTVYRGPLRVRYQRDAWTPLGLPAPFIWLPQSPSDNLVVDVIVWGVADIGDPQASSSGYFLWLHTNTGLQRAYLRHYTAMQPATAHSTDTQGIELGFLLSDGNFVAHGGGCRGATGRHPEIGSPAGAWPQIGGQVTVELDDGPPSSAAVLTIGADTRTAYGLTLPYDLGIFGAPGCSLWHDVLATSAAAATDATGASSLTLPIPTAAGLGGLRLYASWLALDPLANMAGLTTSGYATIILGT